jgi:hypothetical protein
LLIIVKYESIDFVVTGTKFKKLVALANANDTLDEISFITSVCDGVFVCEGVVVCDGVFVNNSVIIFVIDNIIVDEGAANEGEGAIDSEGVDDFVSNGLLLVKLNITGVVLISCK